MMKETGRVELNERLTEIVGEALAQLQAATARWQDVTSTLLAASEAEAEKVRLEGNVLVLLSTPKDEEE